MKPRSMVIVGVLAGAVLAAIALVRTHDGASAPAPPPVSASAPAPSSLPSAASMDARAPAAAARPDTPPHAAALASPRKEEQRQLEEIRGLLRSDPQKALALLDAGDRAYPSGALIEQRAALRVDALVFAARIGLARDAAEDYLRRFPDGGAAQHIEMLTGVHPRPPLPSEPSGRN